MPRWIGHLFRAVLLTILLTSLAMPATAQANEAVPRVAPRFQQFYDANGGLEIFGLPLSDEFAADGLQVQYFERSRLEWHPEFAGTENEILLGPLGRTATAGRAFPQHGPQPGQIYFQETGYNLGGAFAAFWFAHNGLRLFGYPLSDELTERSVDNGQVYTVQYFERARFEWHPDQGRVLLDRLGAHHYVPAISSQATGSTAGVSLSSYEQQVRDQLMAARADAGIAAPPLDPALVVLARERSADMANRGYFSHTTPEGTNVFALLNAAGIPWAFAGEILARNNYADGQTAGVAGTAYLNSPPHRAVVLDPQYTAMGIGHAVDRNGMHYFTVIFVRR